MQRIIDTVLIILQADDIPGAASHEGATKGHGALYRAIPGQLCCRQQGRDQQGGLDGLSAHPQRFA